MTARDFRTFAGTVLFADAVRGLAEITTKREAKRNVVDAIARVAERLGNTKAVCRKCYVHPEVVEAYLDGVTIDTITQEAEQILEDELSALAPEEAAVLMLLHQRLGARPRLSAVA